MIIEKWGSYYYPKIIAMLTLLLLMTRILLSLCVSIKQSYSPIEHTNPDFNLINIIAIGLTKQVLQKSLHLSNLLYFVFINPK